MKTDLTKLYKSYYTAKSQPELIRVEDAAYISICGKGDPSGEEFAQKTQALFSVAYKMKFAAKERGNDFTVAKLEGLWSFDEKKYAAVSMSEAPVKVPRSEWDYRMLIRMPEFISRKHLEHAAGGVLKKKGALPVKEVQWYEMPAHDCVQILHVGPFDTEVRSLLLIKDFTDINGLRKAGLHHEIYLSDYRRTAPAKLRTILREPVK
jgi:hypothetical protein